MNSQESEIAFQDVRSIYIFNLALNGQHVCELVEFREKARPLTQGVTIIACIAHFQH